MQKYNKKLYKIVLNTQNIAKYTVYFMRKWYIFEMSLAKWTTKKCYFEKNV